MPPEIILIPLDTYYFQTVGQFADGRQFMAFGTAAYPGEKRIAPAKWQDVKRWLAVIHIFDADGNHLTTEARFIGFAREEPAIYDRFETLFATLLGDYQIDASLFCNIWVKPFRIVIDDIYYGLVYEMVDTGSETYEQVTLWPNNVVFYPPWNDGRYDT